MFKNSILFLICIFGLYYSIDTISYLYKDEYRHHRNDYVKLYNSKNFYNISYSFCIKNMSYIREYYIKNYMCNLQDYYINSKKIEHFCSNLNLKNDKDYIKYMYCSNIDKNEVINYFNNTNNLYIRDIRLNQFHNFENYIKNLYYELYENVNNEFLSTDTRLYLFIILFPISLTLILYFGIEYNIFTE
jgi:hypothetical protein